MSYYECKPTPLREERIKNRLSKPHHITSTVKIKNK